MRNWRIYLFIIFCEVDKKRLFMDKYGQIVNNQILYTYKETHLEILLIKFAQFFICNFFAKWTSIYRLSKIIKYYINFIQICISEVFSLKKNIENLPAESRHTSRYREGQTETKTSETQMRGWRMKETSNRWY